MTGAESVADALAAAHPDRDPSDVGGDELAEWLEALGIDCGDPDLLAAIVDAWQARLM